MFQQSGEHDTSLMTSVYIVEMYMILTSDVTVPVTPPLSVFTDLDLFVLTVL